MPRLTSSLDWQTAIAQSALPAALTALVLSLSCGGASASTEAMEPEFTPCRIGLAPSTVAAECASVSVPFTYDLAVEGSKNELLNTLPETLTLAIAKLPARTKSPAADPITLIAGGPGQSALESWPQLAAAFHPIRAHRDVYLIDQRGTGQSNALRCPKPPPNSGLTIDIAEVRSAASACFDAQDPGTQWFTTSVAVRDLDSVRKALGVSQWNVYGVSYGTRVALHYLKRYPSHTRTVIVDAVVPPQKPIGPELPLHAQSALDALLHRCENDAGCAEAFPDLSTKTQRLFASLKETPRSVQFENITQGSLDTLLFNDQHLALSVRLLTYSAYGNAILPSMLHDAAVNGNLAPFARQVALQENDLGNALSTGMHSAVVCTEDAQFIEFLSDRETLSETFLGDFIVDAMQATCESWPVGVIDDDFNDVLVSDVPVLALSGAVDPITPPSYAELAVRSLTNAKHIVNPHQAHTQAPLGCMPLVMAQFVETASPSTLNLDCLDRLTPPSLFIDANGPLP
jgi:pimeloyl-ACP methyl ester carboxylesterase